MSEATDLLDELERIVSKLESVAVSDVESHACWVQARRINGRLWGVIREVQAYRIRHWYDLAGLVSAMAQVSHSTPGEVWANLLESDALRANPEKLIRAAESLGVDVAAHLNEGINDG